MFRSRLILLALGPLALAACASSGGIDSTDPIIENGVVEPQRNLLMSDLSFGSPANGRAIDEVFDVAVSTFAVAPDENGSTGLVRGSASREGFGAGNSLTFTAGINEFVFDIDTAAGTYNETVYRLLFNDPAPIGGLQYSTLSTQIGSNPLWFSGIAASYGITLPNTTSVATIDAFLTALAESDDEADQEFVAALQVQSDLLTDVDQYFYYTPNGTVEVTNINGDRRTDTVAIISIIEQRPDGSTLHGHMVMGHRTPLEEIPTTGSANYEGKVVGEVLTNNSVRSLTGSVFADVDFTTGLLDISFATLVREGFDQNGATAFLPYKTMLGSGVIDDRIFSGNLFEEDGGDATGEFYGGFFGPVANEIGGTFTFGDGSSFATGGFTGAQPEE